MRPKTDQETLNYNPSPHPRHVFDGLERLTVATAAERLGVSQHAVRKRIARDTIPWVKDPEGRVYVYLDPSKTDQDTAQDRGRNDQDVVQDRNQDSSKTALEITQEQVDYLKETVRARDEELRRKDHLLAAALERIPAIEEASTEARESPVTASSPSEEVERHPMSHRSPHSGARGYLGSSSGREAMGPAAT